MEILLIILTFSVIALFIISFVGQSTISKKEKELLIRDKKIAAKIAELTKANERINDLEIIKTKYQPIIDLEAEVNNLKSEKSIIEENIEKIKDYYSSYELKVDLEEMSYYQPKFNFDNYLEYSDALVIIREAQKELVRTKEIFTVQPISSNKDIANLAVSAFNSDANTIVNSITYNNFEKSKQRLEVSFNKINNLLTNYGLEMSTKYYDLKIQEMGLVYDLKEQERRIKEEQQELNEQMKEEERARVEAEKAREKAIKEQERYEKALEEARLEVEQKSGAERDKFEKQILQLEEKLNEALEERERATAMAQITKKGHVYIISNIGSFGENVYKIGMTRRREPLDRVKELGDASVPFPFDIHAMIYTENAPILENDLHIEFNKNRLNKINLRKEFFNVTIDEIEHKCIELGYKIKLTKLAEAIEYRQTKDLEMSKL